MAASKDSNDDTMERNVLEQPSISRIKIKNPSRPVISTVDPKYANKRREVIQGSGIKDSNVVMDVKGEEIRRLENEVKRLRENLSTAESTIKKLMKRDKEMTAR